jgi:hypothetical protein
MLHFTSKDDTLRSVHAHLIPGLSSWHGNLSSAYEAHSTQCLLHNSSRSHQARFVIDGHYCILPATLLRHMADSGHPPQEATHSFGPKARSASCKKDAGSGEAQARADFDPSADALLRLLTSNDEDKQPQSLTPGEEHGLLEDPQKILDPTDRCISGRISTLNLAKVRQACSQHLWDDFKVTQSVVGKLAQTISTNLVSEPVSYLPGLHYKELLRMSLLMSATTFCLCLNNITCSARLPVYQFYPFFRAPGPNEAAAEANEGSPQAGGAGFPSLFLSGRSGRSQLACHTKHQHSRSKRRQHTA